MDVKMLNDTAVLISVNPQWCRLISIKKKLREIRKNFPKLKMPFTVYIYCTNGTALFGDGERVVIDKTNPPRSEADLKHIGLHKWNGKVIGEFICDGVDIITKRGLLHNFDYCYLDKNVWGNDDIEIEINAIKMSCVEKDDLNTYGARVDKLYAWHITNLVIYDVPKDLSDFRTPPCDKPESACENCKYLEVVNTPNAYEANCYREDGVVVTRPPQNYCFVRRVA